jgi:hypothetical protein
MAPSCETDGASSEIIPGAEKFLHGSGVGICNHGHTARRMSLHCAFSRRSGCVGHPRREAARGGYGEVTKIAPQQRCAELTAIRSYRKMVAVERNNTGQMRFVSRTMSGTTLNDLR